VGLGNLSGGELLILAVIFLLVFGGRRLPEVGKAIGNGMREFHRAVNEARDAVAGDAPPSPPQASAPPPRRLLD
jgi:sec-independent protein translocase protein TatA